MLRYAKTLGRSHAHCIALALFAAFVLSGCVPFYISGHTDDYSDSITGVGSGNPLSGHTDVKVHFAKLNMNCTGETQDYERGKARGWLQCEDGRRLEISSHLVSMTAGVGTAHDSFGNTGTFIFATDQSAVEAENTRNLQEVARRNLDVAKLRIPQTASLKPAASQETSGGPLPTAITPVAEAPGAPPPAKEAVSSSQAMPTKKTLVEPHAARPLERRIALVIGNGAYKEGPLRNPPNDAHDMAAILRSMGFEVIARENAGLAQMEAAVDEFWGKLKKGGVGLFYYAGHGLQVNGRNYLVPVDAKILAEQDVKYKCMDAGLVLGRMENAGNDLNIIILDACRSNPFARSWRSADQGLAKMDAPKGALIAYATAPDSVAADGTGKNGLYTEKLLKAMRVPGQPVEQMFKRVRDEVMRTTKDKQVPWESTSLRGDFYFVP
ncbi:MAG: caspase family protein [Proteobacteria bacterium]|nr:caspase family protein [Pseudomonadota bacterium]